MAWRIGSASKPPQLAVSLFRGSSLSSRVSRPAPDYSWGHRSRCRARPPPHAEEERSERGPAQVKRGLKVAADASFWHHRTDQCSTAPTKASVGTSRRREPRRAKRDTASGG